MTDILAIDLGKFKSVACAYQAGDGPHTFQTLATTPAAPRGADLPEGVRVSGDLRFSATLRKKCWFAADAGLILAASCTV